MDEFNIDIGSGEPPPEFNIDIAKPTRRLRRRTSSRSTSTPAATPEPNATPIPPDQYSTRRRSRPDSPLSVANSPNQPLTGRRSKKAADDPLKFLNDLIAPKEKTQLSYLAAPEDAGAPDPGEAGSSRRAPHSRQRRGAGGPRLADRRGKVCSAVLQGAIRQARTFSTRSEWRWIWPRPAGVNVAHGVLSELAQPLMKYVHPDLAEATNDIRKAGRTSVR